MTIESLMGSHPVAIPDARGVPERRTIENFVGVYQAADNWCWAAAAASVMTSSKTKPEEKVDVHEQCLIVEQVLGGGPACDRTPCQRGCKTFGPSAENGDGRRSGCLIKDRDKAGFLNLALEANKMLAGSVSLRSGLVRPSESMASADLPTLDTRMTIEAFDELLAAGHLVCLRTRRRGARHFIIVYGCETYPEYSLLIWDPEHGTDVIEADRFEQEHGPFTHKIVTRKLGVSP